MKQVDALRWSGEAPVALRRYISSNKPLIIKALSDFQPLDWTINALERRYGDIIIRVIVSDSQKFSYDENRERTVVRLPLTEFLDRGIRHVGAEGKYYALGRGPAAQFPGLMEEIVLPDGLARFVTGMGRFLEKNVWMSPGGTRTALHFDTVENFNIQIEGEKNFWLYPPRIKGMYPHKLNSQAAYVSPVDPRQLDQQAFPNFPESERLEGVLKPGDLLYLPYGWWHQVDTCGERNLNVNFWWLPRWKLISLWQQSLRGAFVLAHRRGAHPHKRAEKFGKNAVESA
jgi:hypothetical protein